MKPALAAAVCLAVTTPASAFDWTVEGAVTMVEPSYAPVRILFTVDVGAGSCPAGSLLRWEATGVDTDARQANFQAVFSALLTSQFSRIRMRLHGNNTNCSIEFIHAL